MCKVKNIEMKIFWTHLQVLIIGNSFYFQVAIISSNICNIILYFTYYYELTFIVDCIEHNVLITRSILAID
jgi:hypothetical protein